MCLVVCLCPRPSHEAICWQERERERKREKERERERQREKERERDTVEVNLQDVLPICTYVYTPVILSFLSCTRKVSSSIHLNRSGLSKLSGVFTLSITHPLRLVRRHRKKG